MYVHNWNKYSYLLRSEKQHVGYIPKPQPRPVVECDLVYKQLCDMRLPLLARSVVRMLAFRQGTFT